MFYTFHPPPPPNCIYSDSKNTFKVFKTKQQKQQQKIHSTIPKIQKQLQEVKKHLENRSSQKWMFWFPNIIEISKTEKYLLNSNKNNYNNIFFRKPIPPKWVFWFKQKKSKQF